MPMTGLARFSGPFWLVDFFDNGKEILWDVEAIPAGIPLKVPLLCEHLREFFALAAGEFARASRLVPRPFGSGRGLRSAIRELCECVRSPVDAPRSRLTRAVLRKCFAGAALSSTWEASMSA